MVRVIWHNSDCKLKCKGHLIMGLLQESFSSPCMQIIGWIKHKCRRVLGFLSLLDPRADVRHCQRLVWKPVLQYYQISIRYKLFIPTLHNLMREKKLKNLWTPGFKSYFFNLITYPKYFNLKNWWWRIGFLLWAF